MKCHQNLITSRGRYNTYSYQVISISAKQFFTHCTDSHKKDEQDCKILLCKVTRSSATAEITRDADDAIQGHSRSSVVVRIDVEYMTSY